MDNKAVFPIKINEQIAIWNDLGCFVWETEHPSIILCFCPSHLIDFTDLDSSEEDDAEYGSSEKDVKNAHSKRFVLGVDSHG